MRDRMQDGGGDWYYYTRAGQQMGPFDFDQMRQAAAAGHFQRDDYVWQEGEPDWRPAHEVAGLFNDAATPGGGEYAAAPQPSPWPPQPQPAFPTWFIGYAGFWRRLVAYIIDSLLLTLASAVFLIVMVMLGILPEYWTDPDAATEGGELAGNLVGVLLAWLYFALFESSSYQATPGKMAMGICVTDMYGRRISFPRATGRHFGKILSGLTLLIGFIMAAFTARKQALHDILASCLVIQRP